MRKSLKEHTKNITACIVDILYSVTVHISDLLLQTNLHYMNKEDILTFNQYGSFAEPAIFFHE